MCTYITEKVEIFASAKGPDGWYNVDRANVYFDHPVHVALGHSLNIDFVSEKDGAQRRVAVEMSAASARELVSTILAILDSPAVVQLKEEPARP